MKGRERDEHCGDGSRDPSEPPPTRHVDEAYETYSEQDGQKAYGCLADPEAPGPEMKEQVVEGWIPIVPKRLDDATRTLDGDPNRGGLVVL